MIGNSLVLETKSKSEDRAFSRKETCLNKSPQVYPVRDNSGKRTKEAPSLFARSVQL